MSSLAYRREIDGLRALAVMPVLLFHGGFEFVPGGFVGVDVFFVISGFLITSIILKEVRQDNFSIINFYERRARRILPALSIVLIFTTVAAYIFMPAAHLQEFSQSLVSVSVFLSNVFFFLETGYFSLAAEEMPLLHTWSLAVEEQYYVFFPLMVMALWAYARKLLLPGIIITSILSLLISQYFSTGDYKEANFFLIFSRAWELFFGSIIAFVDPDKLNLKKWQKEALSIIGFLMILYAITMFNNMLPFPSFYTLIPVVGSCLVILFSNEFSIIGRILSLRVCVFIGLISYSLYLWHQPIYAFLRLKTIGPPGELVFFWAIIASIIFAYISWKYIEAPFRNKKNIGRASIFKYSALSIAAFMVMGFVGHINQGFDARFGDHEFDEKDFLFVGHDHCMTLGEHYVKPEEACRYEGENITWAVFGDSHSNMLAHPLSERLLETNEGVLHLSYAGCPPALGYALIEHGCTEWTNDALEYLEQQDEVEHVILAYRHARYLYGDQTKTYPKLPQEDFRLTLDERYSEIDLEEAHDLYWESFGEIVDRLIAAGKIVHILYPVPELPTDIRKAVTPVSVFNRKPMLSLDEIVSMDYYLERNGEVIAELDKLAYDEQLKSIHPEELLCQGDYCKGIIGNRVLYRDDNHLNIHGVREFFALIFEDEQETVLVQDQP